MIEIPVFALFLIITTVVTLMLMVAIFAGRRGSPTLMVMVTVAIIWSLTSALHDLMPIGPGARFVHEVDLTSFIWMAYIWLILVIEFARLLRRLRLKAILLSLPLVLFTIPLWFFPSLEEDAYMAAWWYGHFLNLVSLSVLLPIILRSKGERRYQALIMLLCTIGPMGFSIYNSFRGERAHTIEPEFMLISAVLFAIGMIGFRLMNLLPIGYERILAGMRKGVIFVNPNGQVAYLNPAMEKILGQPANKFIGKPARTSLAAYPQLVDLVDDTDRDVLEDITFINGMEESIYEVYVTDLRDSGGESFGRLATLNDITRRVATENALRQSRSMLQQSEEKYRSLVENINEVIYVLNLDGTIDFVSPVIERFTGYKAVEVIGSSFRQFVLPEDLPGVQSMLEQVLNTGESHLEFRILDREQKIRNVHASILTNYQDGQPASFQGVLTDITERIQVEKALERQASQLKIINDIGEQIAQVMELELILNNAAHLIRKYFGYYHVALFTPRAETQELVMRASAGAFSQFYPEDHRLRFDQGMVGWAAQNKKTLLANDVRLEPHYVNLYPNKIVSRSELAVPILLKETLVGVLDIQSPQEGAFTETDVRLMETVADQIAVAMENARLYDEVRLQLKERERKENMMRIQRDLLVRLSSAHSLEETLKNAVENLAVELHAHRVAILMVDRESRVARPVASLGYSRRSPLREVSLNDGMIGWVVQTGIAALFSEVIGVHSSNSGISEGTQSLLCVPLISNAKSIGIIVLESAETNAFTYDDQHLLTVLASSLVMLIDRAQLFEAVENARTELEKRATALEEANAGLREMDRLKSQFLANMSHELRTPLNSIIGFSEVMLDGIAGSLNPEQAECAQDILDSGNHLLSLINDLLDFSKIEAGHIALDFSLFDVQPLFEALRITVAPLIEKKSQVLVFRQDGSLPMIRADHLRIKQVLINLVSNANKFTPEGGTITASCRLADATHMLFAVHDTGIGISPEDQEIIFEEFRQVDGSMTREVAGSGLGLAISKQIVELHGGTIWVSSEPGKGSTFYVRIPVDAGSAVESAAAGSAAALLLAKPLEGDCG